MKQATEAWVEKAEGDFLVAQRELAAASPVYDAVCFHAQQCVEKYPKAILQEHGVAFPRTHDLVVLAALVGALAPSLGASHADLTALSTFAVDLRYPGASANRHDAEFAVRLAGDVRAAIRTALAI